MSKKSGKIILKYPLMGSAPTTQKWGKREGYKERGDAARKKGEKSGISHCQGDQRPAL